MLNRSRGPFLPDRSEVRTEADQDHDHGDHDERSDAGARQSNFGHSHPMASLRHHRIMVPGAGKAENFGEAR
jgi:hypothetical protein